MSATPSAETPPAELSSAPVAAAPQPVAPPALPVADRAAAGRSAFVPLLIVLLTATGWAGFQFYQLRQEAVALKALHANQDNPIQQAQRVRQTLDSLAAQTKRLADGGNPNARAVVDELGRRGITINPQPAASAAKP